MAEQTIGGLIDALGVSNELEPNDLASDAVVLLKVVDGDGKVNLRIRCSSGMSWIECIGMLRAAEFVNLDDLRNSYGED